MASKIVTMFAIAIILAISIQIVTSNDPPKEEEVDPELVTLFSEKKNLQKLLVIFAIACKDKKKAKNKINSYRNTPPKVDKILKEIAEKPKATMAALKPIRDALDKKFMEYGVYGMVVKPVWHITQRIGCAALRLVGVSIWSTGELIHSLHDAVQESMEAAGHKPEPEVKQLMGNIDEAGDKVKEFGNKVSGMEVPESEKTRRGNAASGSAEQTGKPAHGDSQETKEPEHGVSQKPKEPEHGGSHETGRVEHGGSHETGRVEHGGSQETEKVEHGGSQEAEGVKHGSLQRDNHQQSDGEVDHATDP